MSLEMYAHRRYDVKQWEHDSPEERYSVCVRRGGKPVDGIKPDRISKVEEEVMKWDSANHIHGWFVDNVMSGKDDGGAHHVGEWKLQELLEVCERVLNGSHLVRESVFKASVWRAIRARLNAAGTSPRSIKNLSVARRLLPLRKFDWATFQDYDEQYVKDVEATRDWAERMLLDRERGLPGEIYYSTRF